MIPLTFIKVDANLLLFSVYCCYCKLNAAVYYYGKPNCFTMMVARFDTWRAWERVLWSLPVALYNSVHTGSQVYSGWLMFTWVWRSRCEYTALIQWSNRFLSLCQS